VIALILLANLLEEVLEVPLSKEKKFGPLLFVYYFVYNLVGICLFPIIVSFYLIALFILFVYASVKPKIGTN